MNKIKKLLLLLLCVAPGFNLYAGEFATVKRIQGEVSVGKVLITKVGEKILVGSEIYGKGKKSFIELMLSTGSIIRLSNGKIRLETLKKQKTVFTFLKGIIHTYLPKGSSAQTMKINTPISSFGVRGTKFWLQTDEEDYLCVCEGTVEAEKNGEKISVFAGEDIHINKTGGELKKLKASKMMLDMAKQTFLEMGYPVK